MAASFPSGSFLCLFCQMQGSAVKMRVRDRVQEDKSLFSCPAFTIRQAGGAYPAVPATYKGPDGAQGAQGSAPSFPSQVVEPDMVSGQEDPSVLHREWGRKYIKKDPSLGCYREAPCYPGLHPLSVSERTGIKSPGKQESHVRKSLPVLSPPTNLLIS